MKDSLTKGQQNLNPNGDFESEDESIDEALKDLELGEIKRNKYRETNRMLPIGIVQLINSKDGRTITDYDKRKFEMMSNIIGLAIDNCQEMLTATNIKLTVLDSIKNVSKLVHNTEMNHIKGTKELDTYDPDRYKERLT